MNERTRRPHRLIFSCVGLGLAVCTGGCNAEDANNPGRSGARAVAEQPGVVRETCADNSLFAECRGVAPAAAGDPAASGTARSDIAALARGAAENILASNCGRCHGPALDSSRARAGMNYIDDMERLVQAGVIVPLSATRSRIVQRMLRGEMPPISSGLPRVTSSDIAIVSDFIDNPRFWPGAAPAAPVVVRDCSTSGQLLGFDELFRAVKLDLARADNDDAPFYRYVSLTNRYTAGICGDALDHDRQALIKMLNMLSVRATIRQPEPINEDETLYRVDLRDFDWDRSIAVEGQRFDDVWEAIAAKNPYSVPFVGNDADDAVEDSETEFPVMFADQMLDVATIGNLYYGIIGVDLSQGLSAFVANELGIDVPENIAAEDTMRAGTTRSRISRQDRLVERHDMGVRGGVLWQSFDFSDESNESIFDNPFGFTPGGTEAIFTLPNGMLAFLIADENDNIVEDSDILLDTSQNNFRAVTSVSCSNCHAGGFIPVVDEVGEVARANARSIGLTRDELDQLESIYVSPDRFAEQVREDSQFFYERALQLAALPVGGGDPVANVFLRFDADLSLADVAGDLGVTPEDLENSLGLLEPALTVLRRGTLDRDDFSSLFVASLCVLASTQENRPDPSVCDGTVALAD
ncbi:MAG: Serine/threonine-protein kinase pkn1 [Pseudomonadota bacterium]|jgi:mono/diheme cytochrome c family protein